jgi:hypothetical protein
VPFGTDTADSPGVKIVFALALSMIAAAQAAAVTPALSFSTTFGGTRSDQARDVAVDSEGFIYIVGDTSSGDFPVWNPVQALPPLPNGTRHIFVTKLDPTGSTILFSTYLGGSVGDSARKIAVDSNGYIYVAGSTVSWDFPITSGALRPIGAPNGRDDITLTKINISDSSPSIVYSAVIGGVNDDEVAGLAVDGSGNCFLTGSTNSPDFPTTAGARNDLSKLNDLYSTAKIFVLKVNASGTALIYSSVFGGSGADQATALTVDQSGAVYVAGGTTSADFPVTSGAYRAASQPSEANRKGFVAKFSTDGSVVQFATYVGGSASEQTSSIALGSDGKIYVTGLTTSPDFPVTPGAYFAPVSGGANAVFVARFVAGGAALDYSAVFGGSSNRVARIAVDHSGQAVVVGSTDFRFPVIAGAPQVYPGTGASLNRQATNAFILKLNGTGSAPVFSTYLGGNNATAASVALDIEGAAIVSGTGDSTFPVTPGERTFNPGEIFVAKLSDAASCTYTVQALSPLNAAVSTQSDCEWIAVSGVPWLSVSRGNFGSGSGTVQIVAQQNTGLPRSGTLSIAGSLFTVNQPSGCQFTLSSTSQTFSSDGGTDQFSGFTTYGCTVPAASSSVSWVHINPTPGSPESTYAYLVDRNTTGQPRTGTINIGSQAFTVTQGATACTYSVSPASLVALAGNTASITVTANYSTCAWTADSNSSWSGLFPRVGRGTSTVVVDTDSIPGGPAQIISATVAGKSVLISSPGQGLSFEISNKLSGQALDVINYSLLNGARIQQYTYLASGNQQWELIPAGGGYYAIMNRLSKKVLDVANYSTLNTAAIQQYDYLGGDNQKWTIIAVEDGFYEIVNKSSGKALDVTGFSKLNGALIQQYDFLGGDNQKWRLTPIYYFKVINKLSGRALDVANFSFADGATIQQWDYLGGANQQWQLFDTGKGWYKITNNLSGKVLDVANCSLFQMARIQQWNDLNGDNQKWSLIPVDAQYYKIVNKNSGMVLDVTNFSMANGARIQQYDYVGGDNQKWQFIPVLSTN